MTIDIERPQPDELEITTLGPGLSSGESIVVHLIGDEWIIIDSCKSGDEVLPLEYLRRIGVDCKEQVKMVICTHWHWDHIQGMSEILNECVKAKFYLAPVGDFKGYLDVVLKLAGIDPLGSNIWNELNNCLDALYSNNQRTPRLLTHNERIVHFESKEMFAIGPSDEMCNRFHVSLLKIDPFKPQKSDIESLEGNLCSLALSINYKGQKALIGGDMEVGRVREDKYKYHLCRDKCHSHENCGWCEAISDGNVFADEKPYHFINLPHHSSSSSFCPKMWEEGMAAGGPIATTTVFKCARGEALPTREMLELYRNKCKELYITSSDSKNDDNDTGKLEGIDGVEVLDEMIEKAGIIVSRWRTNEEGWITRCFGEARMVDDKYLESYHT